MTHTQNVDPTDASSSPEGSLNFLMRKLRDLTLRNQDLESELQLARKRLAFYEGFDDSIRETMTYSLRLAFDIKMKSEQEARDLVEGARREGAQLREESRHLMVERDASALELETLRKAVDEVRRELQVETARREERAAERSRLLTEVAALENRMRSIRVDLESPAVLGRQVDLRHDHVGISPTRAPDGPPDRPRQVPHRAYDDAMVSPQHSYFASAPYQATAPVVDRHRHWEAMQGLAQTPAAFQPPPVPLAPQGPAPQTRELDFAPATYQTPPVPVEVEAPQAASSPVQPSVYTLPIETEKPEIARPLNQASVYAVPFEVVQPPVVKPAEELGVYTFPTAASGAMAVPAQGERPATQQAEPVHVPFAAPPSVTPIEIDKPLARDGEALSTSSAAQSNTDVELVVSPVHSFPKLVELERALQSLPEVKSFYVRDFRYGVATLSVTLVHSELRENLPSKLENLPGWNLSILSCPHHRIEAKIGA
ncbi:MAG: hypothetical protein HY675_03635 [Chloroflexi bacterium]|nr:hypothetical protein [Chloroflexota bacterium]